MAASDPLVVFLGGRQGHQQHTVSNVNRSLPRTPLGGMGHPKRLVRYPHKAARYSSMYPRDKRPLLSSQNGSAKRFCALYATAPLPDATTAEQAQGMILADYRGQCTGRGAWQKEGNAVK